MPQTVFAQGVPWPYKPQEVKPPPTGGRKRKRQPLVRVFTRNLKLCVGASPGLTTKQIAEAMGEELPKVQKAISRLAVSGVVDRVGHQYFLLVPVNRRE